MNAGLALTYPIKAGGEREGAELELGRTMQT